MATTMTAPAMTAALRGGISRGRQHGRKNHEGNPEI